MKALRTILEETASAYPEKTAIQLLEWRLTYRQLRDKVAAAAECLKNLGISSEDTVALLFQNTPFSIVSFLAMGWINGSVISLETDDSLKTTFEEIPVKALLSDEPPQSVEPESYNWISTKELLEAPPSSIDSRDAEAISTGRTFLYQYTSGTLGNRKPALHTQENLVQGGIVYQRTYQLGSNDCILVSVPLAHSFGMVAGLIASIYSGATLVLTGSFVPRQVVNSLESEGVTILVATPFIYDLLSRCYLPNQPNLDRLRVCLSSGGSLQVSVAEAFREQFGKEIFQVYGSTEAGVVATQWPRESAWPHNSVGSPLSGVNVKVVDEKGRDQPCGQQGLLLIKTPSMFKGYYGHDEETQKAFRDGWYVTGDVASLDEGGCLYIIGRKDTFINVGGRKINPTEVQEVLLSHPLVVEVLVYGMEHFNAGQQVCAKVVVREETTENELVQFCRQRLAAYKIPAKIEFVTTLPKTGLGKIQQVL